MDHDAVLAHPIWQVFGHLADPARLGDWLTTATAIHAAHGAAAFTLRLSRDPAQAAAGELIGYEPPWLLAYRLRTGPDTHVLRITCTTSGAGTRVHIRQASCQGGPAQPLAVDLTRLSQALTSPPAAGMTRPGPDHPPPSIHQLPSGGRPCPHPPDTRGPARTAHPPTTWPGPPACGSPPFTASRQPARSSRPGTDITLPPERTPDEPARVRVRVALPRPQRRDALGQCRKRSRRQVRPGLLGAWPRP